MQRYFETLIDARGNVRAGLSVLVKIGGQNATIYSDDGTTVQANPMTSDANGGISFYAANGTYDLSLVAASGSVTALRSQIILFDPLDCEDATPTSSDTVLGVTAAGAVRRFAVDELVPTVSAFRYMTAAQIADVQAGTLLVDVTAAIQAAADTAYKVHCPPGRYRFDAGITCAHGVLFEGLSPRGMGGPTNLGGVGFYHGFSGDFFTFDGSDGSTLGAGCGFRRINLVNNFGAAGSANGNAIVLSASSEALRPTWFELDGVCFEVNTGKGNWTRNLYLDGSNGALATGEGPRDLFLTQTRFYADTGSTAAIEALNVSNVMMDSCFLNGTKGDVLISGDATRLSGSWQITNCVGNLLAIDYAQSCSMTGNSFATLTGTANTLKSRYVGRLTNTYSAVSGLSAQYWTLAAHTPTETKPATFQALTTHSVGINVGNVAQTGVTTLDWYEEGSFTPVVVGSGTAGTGTYTAQSGSFLRLGNRVFYQIILGWSAHTGAGNLQVGGLPYTSTGSANAPGAVYYDGLTGTAGEQVVSMVNTSATTLSLYSCDPTGGSVASVALDTSVASLRLSGFYTVA